MFNSNNPIGSQPTKGMEKGTKERKGNKMTNIIIVTQKVIEQTNGGVGNVGIVAICVVLCIWIYMLFR